MKHSLFGVIVLCGVLGTDEARASKLNDEDFPTISHKLQQTLDRQGVPLQDLKTLVEGKENITLQNVSALLHKMSLKDIMRSLRGKGPKRSFRQKLKSKLIDLKDGLPELVFFVGRN